MATDEEIDVIARKTSLAQFTVPAGTRPEIEKARAVFDTTLTRQMSLASLLDAADLIVSCTGSVGTVIDPAALSGRGGRSVFGWEAPPAEPSIDENRASDFAAGRISS